MKRLRRALMAAPAVGLALGLAACSGGSTIPSAVSSPGSTSGAGGASSAASAKGGSLTVMEIAGYLGLPVSVCIVLAEQLVADGQLKGTAPVSEAAAVATNAERPSKEVMEEVLSGLRALLV